MKTICVLSATYTPPRLNYAEAAKVSYLTAAGIELGIDHKSANHSAIWWADNNMRIP
jgi:hypothetical protein